jgi:hypothetical protein
MYRALASELTHCNPKTKRGYDIQISGEQDLTSSGGLSLFVKEEQAVVPNARSIDNG